MWGDIGLMVLIAVRSGIKLDRTDHLNGRVDRRVLSNLARCHDGLVQGHTLLGNGRRVRIFWLPGEKP